MTRALEAQLDNDIVNLVRFRSDREIPMKFCLVATLIASICNAAISPLARAEALGCLIEPSQVADMGSEVVGVLEKLHVNRGDLVTKGQPAAELDSRVERAAVAAAHARAKALSELLAAQSNFEFAKRKMDRTEDLYNKKFVSEQANDQVATESRVAELRFSQAREQKNVAERELTLAQAQLARRTLKSPISGVVLERYLSRGERVEQKPVLRIATVDPLHVEVFVPAVNFNTVQIGNIAMVRPEMAGFTARKAKVILVDRVIAPASNTFRVRLELPNANGQLPAGVRCKVDFTGTGFDAPTAAGGPSKSSKSVSIAQSK